MARQLAIADTKLIFSLVDNAESVINACSINKSRIPIVSVKTDQRQSLPDKVVDFANLMDISSSPEQIFQFEHFTNFIFFRC